MAIVLDGTNGITTETGSGDVSVGDDLIFTGTGNRITGDFSNATFASRVAFQTSTVNANTGVPALPNGTASASFFIAFNNSDLTNAGFAALTSTSVDNRLTSGINGTGTNLPMTFYTGGSERVRIDTSGNVGIGTSSPGGRLEVQGGDVIVKTTDSNTTKLGFKRATPFHGDQVTGAIHTTAPTVGFSDGGGLAFATMNGNNSGTASLTDRVFIDEVGSLLVNRTANTSTASQVAISYNANAGTRGLGIQATVQDIGTAVQFVNTSGAVCGTISQGTSTTAYNTSSDYRLKHDIQPMTGALAKVAALKPVTYKWNADNSQDEGFIAHELAEVCPSAVSGEKDAVNEDGSIKPQGIDTSFLVATLTAAIQEQQAIITALTARVEALEGAQA
jgi:hypothetical protein